MLALIYCCCVVLLQHLVNGLTGQVEQSPLIIISSTLAIAALFQPLRQRIQKIIDRRFYRRKYDAARTLADFSVALRDQGRREPVTGALRGGGSGDDAANTCLVMAAHARI